MLHPSKSYKYHSIKKSRYSSNGDKQMLVLLYKFISKDYKWLWMNIDPKTNKAWGKEPV